MNKIALSNVLLACLFPKSNASLPNENMLMYDLTTYETTIRLLSLFDISLSYALNSFLPTNTLHPSLMR
jgi:hypothetical protein